jgi:hypothetical protein
VKNFFNNGHSSEAMEYGVFSIPALLKMNPEPAAVLGSKKNKRHVWGWSKAFLRIKGRTVSNCTG